MVAASRQKRRFSAGDMECSRGTVDRGSPSSLIADKGPPFRRPEFEAISPPRESSGRGGPARLMRRGKSSKIVTARRSIADFKERLDE